MADTILFKRDATPGLEPSTTQLALGEIAINTFDGKIFTKKNDGTEQIIEIGFPVPTNGVTTNAIVDGAVTEIKLADASVTNAKVGVNAISTTRIVDGAVTSDKIADNGITNAKLVNNSVTANKLADSAVTSAKILDGTIQTIDIGNLQITTPLVAANAITDAKVDTTITIQTSTTGAIKVPEGNSTQRTTTQGKGIRYSTTHSCFEFYNGTDWTLLKDGGNGITVDNTGIYMNGSYTGTFEATGDLVAFSDERLKHKWEDLDQGVLDKALDVKYGSFERKDLETNTRHIGVSAQDLAKVMPSAVRTNEDGIMTVNYGGASLALLLELNKKVSELETEIKKLKGE